MLPPEKRLLDQVRDRLRLKNYTPIKLSCNPRPVYEPRARQPARACLRRVAHKPKIATLAWWHPGSQGTGFHQLLQLGEITSKRSLAALTMSG